MRIILLLLVLVSIVWGWTAVEYTDNSVEHPGHCYSKAINVGAMEKGENKIWEGVCVKANCNDDTNIYYYGCDEVQKSENCKLVEEDLSKPYPDCCAKLECP